jgi:hypothetical protein
MHNSDSNIIIERQDYSAKEVDDSNPRQGGGYNCSGSSVFH